MTGIDGTRDIDARGFECPVPTQQAVEAMREARAAGRLDVFVVHLDDAICAADIPHHARALGFEVVSERAAGPEWTITLRPRTAAAADEQGGT